MLAKLNAEDIKAKLIDYLFSLDHQLDLIASEIPYANKKRWVDLLSLDKNGLHAYEIKSERDSLRKLSGQIQDYVETFHYTTVVIAEKHYLQVENLIPESVGIIQIDSSGKLKRIRSASIVKQLNAINLSFFLWKEDILRFFPSLEKNKEVSELRRNIIDTFPISKIQEAAILSLKSRYQERFDFFKKDKGLKRTSREDLEVLTLLRQKDL